MTAFVHAANVMLQVARKHIRISASLQAPAKPRSPVGQMVTYYLKMEPHLFKNALDEQFRRLKAEKDEAEQRRKEQKEQNDKKKDDKTKKDGGELVLFQ